MRVAEWGASVDDVNGKGVCMCACVMCTCAESDGVAAVNYTKACALRSETLLLFFRKQNS